MYIFLLLLALVAHSGAQKQIQKVAGTRLVQDQCQLNSDCSHRGICKPVPNILGTETNLCHCPPGFSGPQCQYAACRSNPCLNDGICEEVRDHEFVCHCPLEFTGYGCEFQVEKTACSDNPCINGLCRLDGSTDKAVCDCFYHFTGPKCDQETKCDWTTCSGHGTCSMKNGRPHCQCDSGWEGDRCQTDIDECALSSKPCITGTCQNTPGSYVCHCPSNRIGPRCGIPHNGDCDGNPCQNGGSCRKEFNEVSRRFFTCTCAPGFTGDLCHQKVDECTYKEPETGLSTTHCDNGGVCIDVIGGYKCRCKPGYTGPDCHDNVNKCTLFGAGYCLNGGTCTDEYGDIKCACVTGFTGDRCEASVDDCKNNVCHPSSKCIDGLRRYDCECPPNRMGIYCEFLNPCVTESPCENGECVPLTHLGTYKCKCKPGYTGPNCKQDIDECSANTNPCDRGTCVNLPGSFRCDCEPGFEGEYCDKPTNECITEPCLNGGTCYDKTADFQCVCMSGWTGKRCDEPKPYSPECTSHYCLHGGVCQRTPLGQESCVCPPRFTGISCEERRPDPCSVKQCQNSGVCIPTNDYKSFTCACTPGFAGALCEQLVESCDALPCVRGTCLTLLPTDNADDVDFTCSCDPGFIGTRCERRIPECEANTDACGPGICIDIDNGFTCACPSTHIGPRCELPVTDPCHLSPCLNDGICHRVDLRGNFQCTCPSGFSGPICQFSSEVCSAASCLHGGICDPSGGCQCAPGYGGKHCERELNRCAREECRNGGTCENVGDTGFICHCAFAYAGTHCDKFFDVSKYDSIEKAEVGTCQLNNCSLLAGNGVCDAICNLPGCDFDGGDCTSEIARPLAVCPYEKYCKYVLNNGVCDELCNNEACLFDGFDCAEKSTITCPEDKYCRDRYGDGICDPVCNVAGCGWDGGDCSRSADRKVLDNSMKLILITDAERFVEYETQKFLMAVSYALHAAARFQTDEEGHPMIYHWSEESGQGGRIELPEVVLMEMHRKKREANMNRTGVVVYLVFDVSVCPIAGPLLSELGVEAVGIGSSSLMTAQTCFTNTEAATNLLAMESRQEVFDEMGVTIAKAEPVVRNRQSESEPTGYGYIVGAFFAFCLVGVIVIGVVRRGQNRGYHIAKAVYDLRTHNLVHKTSDASDYEQILPMSVQHKPPPPPPQSFPCLHAKVSSAEPLTEITPEDAHLVTIPDKDGQTCIHCAVDSISTKPDNVVIADIEKLIAAGANVTAVNNNGETALHIAIKRSRVEVARYLLNKIDVNAADKDGFTPLYMAVSMKLDVLIDDILAMENVDVNAVTQGHVTPLMKCAKEGDEMIPIVEKLLAYPGIDVNRVGDKTDPMFTGRTALNEAALTNSVGIMKLLIKKGAHVAAVDAKSCTSLLLAVMEKNVDAVRLLLERMSPAAVETANDEDRTPKQWAKERDCKEIYEMLKVKLGETKTPEVNNQLPPAPIQMPPMQIPQVPNTLPPMPPQHYYQQPMVQQQQPMYPPAGTPLRSIENISGNRVNNSPRTVKQRASKGHQQQYHPYHGHRTQNHNNSFNSDSAYSSASSAHNTSANTSNSFSSGGNSFTMSPNASNIDYDQASLVTMMPNPQYYENQNMALPDFNMAMFHPMQMPQQQQYMNPMPNYPYNMLQQQQQQQMYHQMYYDNQYQNHQRRSS